MSLNSIMVCVPLLLAMCLLILGSIVPPPPISNEGFLGGLESLNHVTLSLMTEIMLKKR